jgi:hypothetical protein
MSSFSVNRRITTILVENIPYCLFCSDVYRFAFVYNIWSHSHSNLVKEFETEFEREESFGYQVEKAVIVERQKTMV